ncbi:MAG TPA: CdaR family protein [Vicinamibacterales bacterium]|nr:CdaR family protein [Vicinamibacterales bacterium]
MARLTSFWLFRHFGLRLLSLAVAFALWMAVAGEETVERGIRVPLELVQFPPGLELPFEAPTLVDVRVRGSSTALSRVGPGDIVAVLDLRSARAGRRVFQLNPEQVRVPFGVEVVQVSPASIVIAFEKSDTKTVPVNASTEGSPAPGFVVGKVSVDPPTVQVTGPESAIRRTAEAVTDTVSVVGARKSLSEAVTIGLMDPAIRVKTSGSATVHVEILPGPSERPFKDLPVHLRSLAQGLSAQAVPSTIDIVLRGTREGLSRLEASDAVAYVDLQGLGPGDYPLEVRIDVPSAGVSRIDPPVVQVRITRP